MDFGTRRRFSRDVQFAIVSTLQRDFPAGGLQQLRHRPSARHYAGRHSGARMVPAHQQISPVLANSQRAALQAGWMNMTISSASR